MIPPLLVATVLRARSPWLDDRRVRALSTAIVSTVGDQIDVSPPDAEGIAWAYEDIPRELDEVAALVVIGERESAWRVSVGTCAVAGLGGWGYFGVGSLWAGRYPGGTCGSAQLQARAALEVLRIGRVGLERTDWPWTFGHYIGARAGGRHPEALRRAREWRAVRAMLEAARDA